VPRDGSIQIVQGPNRTDSIGSTGGSGSGGISQLGTSPYGLITVNDSTYKVDTTLLETKLRSNTTRDSLGAIIATKQPQLNGTGYLKFSGTTPSYVAAPIPIADGGTNNASLSVTAGTVYYGDGSKLVGLAPGTAKQHLTGGTTPVWRDTTTGGSGIDSITVSSKNVLSGRKSSVFVDQATVSDTSIVYAYKIGLVGDSTTDNSTVLNAFISSIPANRGVKIIFGYGRYLFNSRINVSRAIIFEGIGKAVHPDFNYTTAINYGATKFVTTVATDTMFYLTVPNIQFTNIVFQNAATTPTAGSAIYAYEGHGLIIDKCLFDNFYDNVHLQNAAEFWILNNQFYGAVNANLYVRDSIAADDGDGTVQGNIFMGGHRDGGYGIYQVSAGGLRVVNNKFNHNNANQRLNSCYYAVFGDAPTSDLIMTNNSFENFLNYAVYIVEASAGKFVGNLVINDNQINKITTSGARTMFVLSGTSQWQSVSIMGNTFRTGVSGDTAIVTYNVFASNISNNYQGYTNPVYHYHLVNQGVDNYVLNSGTPTALTMGGLLGTKATFGTTSSSGTTTPLKLSLGATYGTNAANNVGNLKLLLYDDGTSANNYGFGISTGLLEIHSATALNISTNNGTQALRAFSSGNVTIGTSTTDNGSMLQTTSFSTAYVAKTGTYTATAADHTIDCTSGTFTVTLPTAASIAGRQYTIVNSGSGTITIGTTSSQVFKNINATPTTLTLAPVGAGAIVEYTLQSNGAEWIVTGKVKNE
jgi:hypothetical protein